MDCKYNTFGDLLDGLFYSLNKENIPYFIMRDYMNCESVTNSGDVDVVVEEKYRDRANSIILEEGWKTRKYNLNFYGHQQYYKWDGTRVVKLDIMYGIYFSNGLYSLTNQHSLFSRVEKMGIANIPACEDGLLIHICHLSYDKKEVSDKNRRFLEYLIDNATGTNEFLLTCAKCILSNNNSLHSIGCDLCHNGLVIKHSSIMVKIRWLYIRSLAHFVHKHSVSIALIGVDGTGKSTSIEAINDYFNDRSVIQYMGFKQFQTKIAQKWYSNEKRIPVISFIADCIILPLEMRKRIWKAYSQKKRIVLFDRYPWEIYDNSHGLARYINYVLFKLCFRKPDGLVYLHCPVDISLLRKCDIEDIELFRGMKKRFDKQYLNYPGALVLDSSVLDKDEVKEKTIEYAIIIDSCTD